MYASTSSNTSTRTSKLATQCNLQKRRYPYTTVACDSCKRRKTKCSGGRPCQSCSGSNVACVYKRTTRFRSGSRGSFSSSSDLHMFDTSKPTGLNDKNQEASEASEASAASAAPAAPTVSPISFVGPSNLDHRKSAASIVAPVYGPANSDYYLSVAQRHLAASDSERNRSCQKAPGLVVDGPQELQKLINHRLNGSPGGVMAALSTECWAEVLLTYDEEIGLQYPFLDIERLQTDIGQAARQKTDGYLPHRDQIADIATLILSIVAIFTSYDSAEMSDKLVKDIFGNVVARTLITGGDRNSISLVTLASIYFFLTDRELMAWRGIGTVSRLLQELRSHNNGNPSHLEASTTYVSPKSDDDIGEKMYWTVYTLDRRWSFSTGLPFSLQDADIGRCPNFRQDSLSALYLKHMVAYCSITSEVRRWCLEMPPTASSTPNSMCDFLCFRVLTWQRNLPAKLQFGGIQDTFDPAKESRGVYKLRLTLYLRANQMCTVIYRKAAVRLDGTRDFNLSHASTMATTAQDTVRVLDRLARSTDIYQTQQKTFNHFLETALSSLLLILCCSVDLGKLSCLDEVLIAMDLIRQLSTSSSVSRRLQDKLQAFQAVVDGLRAEMHHHASDNCDHGPSADTNTSSLNATSDLRNPACAFAGFNHVGPFPAPLADEVFTFANQPALPQQALVACYTPSAVADGIEVPPSEMEPRNTALPLHYATSSVTDFGSSDVPFFRFPELTDYLMGSEYNFLV